MANVRDLRDQSMFAPSTLEDAEVSIGGLRSLYSARMKMSSVLYVCAMEEDSNS